MHYFEIIPNQIIRSDQTYFTYESTAALKIGQIVLVEIGKKHLPGIVVREVMKPPYQTKEILRVIEKEPLPLHLVELMQWIADYYATHISLVAQTILPSGVQKKRRAFIDKPVANPVRERTKILLNAEQSSALAKLNNFTEGTFLLHGITGSGKTEIYKKLTHKTLDTKRSVLILVPEIALTSQLIAEFADHFDNLVLTHSQMTEAERYQVWKKILYAKQPIVVIGPRSALFMPIQNIGIIIIDEEHETSFKQEHAPRYSAIRVASKLGAQLHCLVVLGSATPSIVDYYLAIKSGRPILELHQSARSNALPPTIHLVDMTDRKLFKKHKFLSDPLIHSINASLHSNQQVLLFQNRRGGASTTLCENCGWVAECPHCNLPMTLQLSKHCLKCHLCGLEQKVMTSCPNCHKSDIIHKGIGTQLIEQEVQKMFPTAKIARFDADSQKESSLNKTYQEIYDGNIDIIVGTQIIAKGLDLPHLRTVGIVQADTGLSIPDFNSSEKTFQLLTQAIGRVGRNDNETEVIIQTFRPQHPSIIFGTARDYRGFYKKAIEQRYIHKLPPFSYLLKLVCSFKTEATAVRNSKKLASYIKANFHNVTILGPTPCLYEKYGDNFRWQIVIKSNRRETLLKIIHQLPSNKWQFDIDPIGLVS